MRLLHTSCLVLALMLLAACNATLLGAPQTQEEVDRALESQRREDELAQATALKHLSSMDLGLANIPTAQAYLDKLISRIQNAGPQPARFVKVVIRPKLGYNAATTPSGIIVVDIGWLKTMDTEAELAALLSHEYGHIVLDHLKTKNQVGTAVHVVTTAAAVYAQSKGINNDWALGLFGEGWSSLLKTSWSREQEYEADAFALDLTQKLGYAYVASMRAFLDRIQSIEKSIKPAPSDAPSGAAQSKNAMGVMDEHPPIEERIMRLQKIMEGQVRKRPAPQGIDGWRIVRNAPAFKQEEKEVLLANQMLDATIAGRKAEQAQLKKQLEALPRPFKTSATLTMLASVEPQSARRTTYLQQAIAAPDTSFLSYRLLAILQRDSLKQYETANNTLLEGLDRFDAPHQFWPDVMSFHRTTAEMIYAIPENQRETSLSLYATKLKLMLVQLQAKCLLKPDVSEACNWAALNEQQKREAVAAQKTRETQMSNKLADKLKLK
ncbi:M48 family metallopeptidase [Limnohabitans sp.]|uniref:M48 family metallopeptidase n=1 Tax=Limnohabitans sp. TaxID=1907725 RepID=UPI00286EC864|nr:M48 family metallopeptidase [Limnohabitans sp.]